MKIITGDILSPNVSDKKVIICHQVNCKGVMGAGLAKQIKNKYPEVFIKYYTYCLSAINSGKSSDILGDILYVDTDDHNRYKIANIFAQDNYGKGKRYTDYMALCTAFRQLACLTTDEIIRIPFKMGCGLGGGDWSIVYQIIEDELISKGKNVEIWRLL